ncbi:unnamed protein product [Amoebophrya sp. A25]|nr:unnamed protein product [Amoebophrya sp. A25]|eukprot:GSA25T00000867001.1
MTVSTSLLPNFASALDAGLVMRADAPLSGHIIGDGSSSGPSSRVGSGTSFGRLSSMRILCTGSSSAASSRSSSGSCGTTRWPAARTASNSTSFLSEASASSSSFRTLTTSSTSFYAKFEKVPLCEDLDPGVLRGGESCYSDCGKTRVKQKCDRTVLEDGLQFQKDEGCQSKVECIAESRVLCKAVGGVSEASVGFVAVVLAAGLSRTSAILTGDQKMLDEWPRELEPRKERPKTTANSLPAPRILSSKQFCSNDFF